MKIRHSKSKIAGALLGLSLLAGYGIASSPNVQAQYQNDQYGGYGQRDRDRDRDDRGYRRDRNRRSRSNDDYPNWGGSFHLRQTALNAGYNEGMKEGRKDYQKNRRHDYRDSNEYRKGTK